MSPGTVTGTPEPPVSPGAPVPDRAAEVGWGVVPAERGVAAFREVLGGLSQRLAAQSEQVLLVVAGRTAELGTGQ